MHNSSKYIRLTSLGNLVENLQKYTVNRVKINVEWMTAME